MSKIWIGLILLFSQSHARAEDSAKVPTEDAKSIESLFDKKLFRAGSALSLPEIKELVELVEKKNISIRDRDEVLMTAKDCIEAGKVVIPASDLSVSKTVFTESERQACYQFIPDDYKRYQQCLMSAQKPEALVDRYMELSEIYANGWGVKANSKLARALVCHSSSVPAELMGQLKFFRGGNSQGFRFCDFATSRQSTSFCAKLTEDINSFAVQRFKKNLIEKLRQEAREEFTKLELVINEFSEAHAESASDINRGGSIQPSVFISVRDQFLNTEVPKLLREFSEAGQLFANSSMSVKNAKGAEKADAELNAIYQTAIKEAYDEENRKLLREAQRKWLRLRDQFVHLAVVNYQIKEKDLKTAADRNALISEWALVTITKSRIEQLKSLGSGER